MDYYQLKIGSLTRNLPLISITPKIMVASFNILGDRELVEMIARIIYNKIKNIDFDFLVGPEVKVVPLLHELSKLAGKNRYIICRKEIHGYMVSPIKSKYNPALVLDGSDFSAIREKKVIIIDDVVTSGKTLSAIKELMDSAHAEIVDQIAIFKQGEKADDLSGIHFLYTLPVFPK